MASRNHIITKCHLICHRCQGRKRQGFDAKGKIIWLKCSELPTYIAQWDQFMRTDFMGKWEKSMRTEIIGCEQGLIRISMMRMYCEKHIQRFVKTFKLQLPSPTDFSVEDLLGEIPDLSLDFE